MRDIAQYDVLVVGAGFSGISALYRLRKLGLTVKVFESGGDFGGVWHWNRYPGARVDSEWPYYQLNIPEAYRDWDFSERFPDHNEIRAYFAHLDKVLGLRKDVRFNSHVTSAQWSSDGWTVETRDGQVAKAKYMILCTGSLHRRYVPGFPGLDTFKGVVHHTGAWPRDVSVQGKRVGIIGAGATGVQVTQELGKQASELTVFMRRPSYCLPMAQHKLSGAEQKGWKSYFDTLFRQGRKSPAGFPVLGMPMGVLDAAPTEREEWFENIWQRGAFNYLALNYNDVVLSKEANRLVYDFWARKVGARIKDDSKRKLMAPQEPPFFFGTKRSPLEQDYYEVIDQPNVHVVNLNDEPLRCFNATGIVVGDKQIDLDIVVLATGFDSFSGSLTQMGLKNRHGQDIAEIWKSGIRTYLGMTMHGFPNAFMVYSPHAPTALSNGPTLIELQCDWVVSAIEKLEKEGATRIEAKSAAEDDWIAMIDTMNERTLFPLTDSWWNKATIPGQKAQVLTYPEGIETYEAQVREKLEEWQGFEVTH
ncbi:hypothetical protein A1O1_06571 [Capronia coronata CBS 617.96]|uniref:FAD/NAD(P)-binding domain-containing protein n=1 Tax=Capronia coronata CBS 617.96 TaxID=1182541 RepID=W9YAB2_9EURO|nr:uncharacterized protein A1O1_06571 [Capronia coronata CBS 617.96]EXJ86201.1 hypothetical protein A1O1_06571 [Capronia coronata CBS 617.96]